jgi:vancomycin permeability regulator SanA
LIRDHVEPIGLEAGLFDKAMKEEFMRMKLLVAAVGFAALATPALAAEFYIVQDSTTKRCTIVEQKPTSQTTVVVGNGKT